MVDLKRNPSHVEHGKVQRSILGRRDLSRGLHYIIPKCMSEKHG